MVLNLKQVGELAEKNVKELEEDLKTLQNRCEQWKDYRDRLESNKDRHSVPSIPPETAKEIKKRHTKNNCTFDAHGCLENVRKKLQMTLGEQENSLSSKLAAHKKEAKELSAYKTELNNWLLEYDQRIGEAIKKIDDELIFVKQFCQRNNLTLDIASTHNK